MRFLFQVERDDSVKSVVLMSGKPGSFVAGADVEMLKKAKTVQDGANMSMSVFGDDFIRVS
ncbi:hypothetical protein KIN20_023377 [Parelaphostrongylus tenuis]|uniref:Uncharacterized protein n=1 Tax=Parelaphostrongylus tenuis TaxID=148309 RepID=A0AAD5NC55_PARTN|nr:hypothetical protein KIN20_023377 [Parelaphostrongylus tenuis]